MSAEKATALVLRLIDFSETSAVVTLFSREFGKLSALAKGARRPKGPLESALDLLSLCRIVFLRKSSGALDLLTEAKLERRFRPPARELSNLYAGYYVAELLNELTHDYEPLPELFDAAVDALDELARPGPVAAVVLRFELSLLRLLGHAPSFTDCAECGAAPPRAGRVAFGVLAGGVLCEKCRVGKRQVVSVTAEAIALLARFADPAATDWRNLESNGRLRGETRGLVNRYLTNLLGHRPKMHEYLGALS